MIPRAKTPAAGITTRKPCRGPSRFRSPCRICPGVNRARNKARIMPPGVRTKLRRPLARVSLRLPARPTALRSGLGRSTPGPVQLNSLIWLTIGSYSNSSCCAHWRTAGTGGDKRLQAAPASELKLVDPNGPRLKPWFQRTVKLVVTNVRLGNSQQRYAHVLVPQPKTPGGRGRPRPRNLAGMVCFGRRPGRPRP